MRASLRRYSAVGLTGALVLSLALVPAAASAKTAYRVPAAPGFAADIARLPAADGYRAFVAFAPGFTVAEQTRFLASRGLSVVASFHSIDTVVAKGSIGEFRRLRSEPALRYLENIERVPLLGDTGTWATGARVARQKAGIGPFRDAQGGLIDGSGVGVAVVDGGVFGTHPDLVGNMARNFKVLCDEGDPNWVTDETDDTLCNHYVFDERPDSDTSSGHGTHVSGIVAGDGTKSTGIYDRTFVGVAPGAKIYGFGVGDGASIVTELAAASFQWVLDNGASQNPPIRVVTNSWGCLSGCAHNPSSTVNQLASQLATNGVSVLFAAGNAGGTGSGANTCYTAAQGDCTSDNSKNATPGVISVANYDDNDTGDKDYTLSSSSSRGSALGCPASCSRANTWPDVAAPGSGIVATCKPNTALCEPMWPAYPGYYSNLSGTSMATPHTAAAAAMLYQANSTLTPAEVEDILQDTAVKFSGACAAGSLCATNGNTPAPGAYVADPQNSGGTSSYDKGAGLLNIPAALLDPRVASVNDGAGRNGDAALTVSSPANNSTQTGVTSVSGTATDGTVDMTAGRTLISGDAGDYEDGAGAADLDALTVQPGSTGVTYTVKSRNVSDVGAGFVRIMLVQNINGKGLCTPVDVQPAGNPTTPVCNLAGFVPTQASSATRDTANNTVTFTVSHTQLGNPPANAAAANLQVWTYVFTPVVANNARGVRQDEMPGGLTGDETTAPQYAFPYTINPTPAAAGTVTVGISLDGGPESAATVTGSSPSYSWSGSVDLTGLSGTHKIGTRLRVNGVQRNIQIVSVNVPAGNQAPVATPQSVSLAEDGSSTITLTGSDLENDPLTFKVTSLPANGTLAEGATQITTVPYTLGGTDVTYTPGGNFNGIDSFQFKANDGQDSAAAAVSLTITAVNDAPSAADQAVTMTKNTTKTITVGGTDVDGQSLRGRIVTLPAHGSLYDGTGTSGHKILTGELPYLLAANKATYAPATGYYGLDSFTFRAYDGLVDSANIGTVSITITAGDITPPAPPVLTNPAAGSLQPKTVSFSGSAERGATVKVYVDGGTSPKCSSTVPAGAGTTGPWSCSNSSLANGAHTVTVTATDPALNVSAPTGPRSFSVDAVNPGGSMTGPAANSVYVVGQTVTVTGTASDNTKVGSVTVNIRDINNDIKSFPACSPCPSGAFSWTYTTTLGLGYFDIWVTIKDTAGNAVTTPSPPVRVYSAGI
jgi:serine protease AprX